MESRTIDVRGTPVALFESGRGAPLLYLHGIDGPGRSPLLDDLAKTFRVIAPQWPGFGDSTIPSWMMGIADAALFSLDLIDALGLDRLHLAGHSIGGWIAAELAIRNTSRLASLALIAPAGVMPDAAPADDIFLLNGEAAVRAQFFDPSLAEREIAARAGDPVDRTLQNRAGLARLGWTPRLASVQLPTWLHRIDAPTLLVWGEEDRLIPYANHAVFAQAIPRCEVVRLPQCGHAAPIERGRDIAERMRAFLGTRP